MQGPFINLVLLGLLILFFGIQQHDRGRLAFRFWFAGWIMVFLSYLVWEREGSDLSNMMVEAIRLDLLLLGGLAFLSSFLQSKSFSPRTMWATVGVALAVCTGADLNLSVHAPFWLDAVVVVVGEGMGIWVAWTLLPETLIKQRIPLVLLCVVVGGGLIVAAHTGGHQYLQSLVLMQVFESVAVLYVGASSSGRLVRAAGFVGFAAWALFYPLFDLLTSWPAALQLLYPFWDVPKYMVAFAMTLEIFEDSRVEVAELADEYKQLYEDFYVLYNTHPHPMWIYEPQTLQFLSANRATVNTYGYSENELLSMTVDAMEAPLAAESAERPLPAVAGQHGTMRRIHQHKSGARVSVEMSEGRILFQGEPARVALAVDVTERDKLDQELFHKAHHDVLTGLPNRQLLEDRVLQCLARSERDGRRAVLLTIDVDHFKKVNDTYGHLAGDECLKAVAARLQSKIRQVDTIARTGGEEFTAIIGGLSTVEDAEKIAKALLRAFDMPLQLPDCALPLTISIGGAVFPEDGAEYTTLRKLSDEALYRAKEGGRNRASFAPRVREAAEAAAVGMVS